MEQADGFFALVICEDDRVIEICERFEGIREALRKILGTNGINALGKQRHPGRASRLDFFCPLEPSRHDRGPPAANLSTFAYPILYMPSMVYALNHHNGIHIRKLHGSPPALRNSRTTLR